MASDTENPINERVVFIQLPGVNNKPKEENFKTEICSYPKTLTEGQVLIKTLFLSVDPAMRCRMNEDTGVTYINSWKLGETVQGFSGLGIVIKSKSLLIKENEIVTMGINWPWQLYIVLQDNMLQKVEKSLIGERPTIMLSYLGLIGLTALLGIREKGHIQPAKNQTCVISGAAGACGHIAGQIAKLDGCKKVIGICGSDEKCQKLIEKLGFDGAINYKSQNVDQCLKELCPSGIQIYFDNVGGDVSDSVIKQMTSDSHVILCGQISQYNKDVPYPPPLSEHITKILKEQNITRERFLVLNYSHKFEESQKILIKWLKEDKIKILETIQEGLKNTPLAFINMMNGKNIGKQLVHVADP